MAVKTNGTLEYDAKGLDLQQTLFCGQSFVWRQCGPQTPNEYKGVAAGRAVLAGCQGNVLRLRPLEGSGPLTRQDDAFWAHYFALDEDYEMLHSRFARSARLHTCVREYAGIRVLNQPFFETLLCFIISQNNHIPRIVGIVERLCQAFGPVLGPGLYGFPPADVLAKATLQGLAPLRAGFRAKYLLDAAEQVASGTIDEQTLRALPTDEARRQLMRIKGVGPKVADCVLLYALGRREVAPMDVWMKRAMKALFPKGMPACAKGAEGIAQQYIFCWARQNLQAGS